MSNLINTDTSHKASWENFHLGTKNVQIDVSKVTNTAEIHAKNPNSGIQIDWKCWFGLRIRVVLSVVLAVCFENRWRLRVNILTTN